MKKLLIVFLLLNSVGFAQSRYFGEFGSMNSITNQMDGAWLCEAADINGDGLLDIMAGGLLENGGFWYENLGDGNFGDGILITNQETVLEGMYPSDMDGDGDMDILTASVGKQRIAWYENTDGLGNFSSTANIIAQNLQDPMCIASVDIDNDGDKDVIIPTWLDGKLHLYKNDGEGNFADVIYVDQSVEGVIFTRGADIDNDGDQDILLVAKHELRWYENTDGSGDNFTMHQISSSLDYGEMAVIADVNNDGYPDIASTSKYDRKMTLFINDAGNEFSSGETIWETDGGGIPGGIAAADIDGDNDLDLILAVDLDNEIFWFRNDDGAGSFSNGIMVSDETDGPRYIAAADIDNDTDFDIISASVQDDRIAWFENLSTSVNVINQDCFSNHIELYPNPCANKIIIKTTLDFEIYNYLGIKMISIDNRHQDIIEINTSNFSPGAYFIMDTQSNQLTRFLKL